MGEDHRFEGLLNFHDTDPPEHGERRRIASRWMTPRRIRDLQASIDRTVGEVLGRLEPGQEAHFVTEVAKPIPLYVTADFMGIPRQDLTDIDRWSNRVAQSRGVRRTRSAARAERGV